MTLFTGSLTLTEGASYLAFVRMHNAAFGMWLHRDANGDAYAAGQYLQQTVPGVFDPKYFDHGPFDAQFSATFSGPGPAAVSTPEPATLTLVTLGLTLAARRRHRRRAREFPARQESCSRE